VIAGSVDAALLPRPAFSVADIRMEGDAESPSINIEELSANLAFAPLLRGHFQFVELVLISPEIQVSGADLREVLAEFNLARQRGASVADSPQSSSSQLEFAINRIRVEDGNLSIRSSENIEQKLIAIDGQADFAERGPATIQGTFNYEDVPLSINASITPLNADNADGLNVSLDALEAGINAKFTGNIKRDGNRDIRGELTVEGTNTRSTLALLGWVDENTSIPAALLEPLSVKAKITGDKTGITANSLSVDVGRTGGSGTLSLSLGDVPHLDVALQFSAVAIEDWKFASSTISLSPISFASASQFIASANAAEANEKVFRIPDFITADLNITAPLLSYREDVLRDGIFSVSLANGELAVREIGITLPGTTRMRAFGFVQGGNTSPVFDGAIEVGTRDLRSVLNWLGAEEHIANVPRGRLLNASMNSAVQGTLARLSFNDFQATVDTANATGSIFVNRGDRVSIGVDMAIDAVNLDAYIPELPHNGIGELFSGAKIETSARDVYGVTPVFDSLKSLSNFDANLRVAVNSLTAGNVPDGRIGLDVALRNGEINIRSASFDNVAGATLWFSGAVGGFGASPQFSDFQFDIHTDDLGRFGRAFGVSVPTSMRSLAPVTLTGVISGGLAQTDLVTTAKVGGVTIQGNGRGVSLDQDAQLTIDISAGHPSYSRFMRSASSSWYADDNDPGPISLSARILHSKSSTAVEDVKFNIGKQTLSGRLVVRNSPDSREVDAAIADINVLFDMLWPTDPGAQFTTPSTSGPAGRRLSRWSEDDFDWSVLKGWRGSIALAGSQLNVRGIDLRDFTSVISVADGIAELTQWDGYVFGARGNLSLRAASAPVPEISGRIEFSGGDFSSVAAAVNGGGATGLNSEAGDVDFTAQFRAAGSSPHALVESISGVGTLKVSTASVGTGAIAGLLGAVSATTQAESIVPGQSNSPIVLDAKLAAENGVVTVVDGAVKSRSYGGAFSGKVDLPNWLIDVSGRLRLENLPRADAATQRTLPTSVPIRVHGRLDLPNILLEPS